MSTQHTPGPWSYQSGTTTCEKVIGSDGKVIADPWWSRSIEEVDANAYLITAAPDLLQVAREALHVIRAIKPPGNGNGTIVRLEEAIAKATGA